jgi:protein phosphatase
MQRLIEAGELTPDEAERSERRNIILQALGPEPTVKIDLTYQQIRRGDTLVLCTDGLSGLVKKEEIAEIVNSTSDLVEVCRDLIDRANENGGPDNITVIAARFEGDGLLSAGPEDRVGHEVYRIAGSETPTRPQRRVESLRAARVTPQATVPPEPEEVEIEQRTGGRALIWILAASLLILLGAIVFAAHQWHPSRGSSPAPGDSATGTVTGAL